VALISEIEAVPLKRCLKPVSIIHEKHGVRNIVFLAKFGEK
jgi:hypothetical protein